MRNDELFIGCECKMSLQCNDHPQGNNVSIWCLCTRRVSPEYETATNTMEE